MDQPVELPAFCRQCGGMFPSGLVVDPTAIGLVLGNVSGPCPYCGALGDIADAFTGVGNTIALLNATGVAPERLARVRDLIELDRRLGVPVDQIEQHVVAEIPEARTWLNELREMGPIARLVLFLTLLSFILDHQGELLDVAHAAERVVQQATHTPW